MINDHLTLPQRAEALSKLVKTMESELILNTNPKFLTFSSWDSRLTYEEREILKCDAHELDCIFGHLADIRNSLDKDSDMDDNTKTSAARTGNHEDDVNHLIGKYDDHFSKRDEVDPECAFRIDDGDKIAVKYVDALTWLKDAVGKRIEVLMSCNTLYGGDVNRKNEFYVQELQDSGKLDSALKDS